MSRNHSQHSSTTLGNRSEHFAIGMEGAACFFLPRSITDNSCSHPASVPAWLSFGSMVPSGRAACCGHQLLALDGTAVLPSGPAQLCVRRKNFLKYQEVTLTTCHRLWEPCHLPPWETCDQCPLGAGAAGKPTKGTSERPH